MEIITVELDGDIEYSIKCKKIEYVKDNDGERLLIDGKMFPAQSFSFETGVDQINPIATVSFYPDIIEAYGGDSASPNKE